MLLIGNGRVITRDQENPYLEDGAVVISGEKIKEVGSLTEMKAKYPEAEFVDAKGGVIMPGLINAHTHIYSGLARGLSIAGNNPTNFLEVLDGTWWAIDRHLTLDGTKACAYATVLDCIRNGVTTIFDHHASFGEISGSLFAIKDVVKELGIRSCLCYEVSERDDSITVCGKEIKIYAFPDANNCPWGELKVDVVLECSGFYTSKEKAQAHINAGARKVVISAPAGNDLPTIVYNTNHETLKASDTIISAASCTTNCLAPMADALNKLATIKSGIMCTIHAYTGDQMTLDGPQRKGDLRRSRAAAVNIVPNSTGAAKAIGLVIPELNGKLIGSAQRVPTPTGSTTILTAVVEGNVTVDEINAAMKAAANESYGYNEDEIVSSDIVGMRYGSLFDATQTMALPLDNGTTEVQVVSWYDNENSYTSQMVRTIKYFSELA